jgi:hypothetical protein
MTGYTLAQQAPKPDALSTLAIDAQLLEFARSNPSCNGFTDLCRTCIRGTDREIQCSLPGIACIKQSWTCTQHATEKR